MIFDRSSSISLPLLLATASLISGPNAAGQNASLTIPIDQTWRAIGPLGDLTGQGLNNVGLEWEAAHTGWNSQLGFDDSAFAGWTDAIQVIHPNEPHIRYWVDGTETVGSSPAYFRRKFTIPGQPIDGNLDFDVDDDAKIFVNGNLVFDEANGLATAFTDLNLTPFLLPGPNLIAVKAQDQQGAQSIAGRIQLVYVIPEPTGAMLLVLAAVGLQCSRSRSRHRGPGQKDC